MEYCHGHRVAHRDLKLDNTLLDDHDPPFIRICDFGFAKNFDANSNMFTQIGTPVYMSPEVGDLFGNDWGNGHGVACSSLARRLGEAVMMERRRIYGQVVYCCLSCC